MIFELGADVGGFRFFNLQGPLKNMEKHADFGRKTIVLCTEYMNCAISVHCQQLDYGYEVRIFGGQCSHVGSVTVSDEQGTLQTITLPGHKENIITEQWASEIQEIVKQPVTVMAGVHYDDLKKEQLQEVIQLLNKLLADCKAKL